MPILLSIAYVLAELAEQPAQTVALVISLQGAPLDHPAILTCGADFRSTIQQSPQNGTVRITFGPEYFARDLKCSWEEKSPIKQFLHPPEFSMRQSCAGQENCVPWSGPQLTVVNLAEPDQLRFELPDGGAAAGKFVLERQQPQPIQADGFGVVTLHAQVPTGSPPVPACGKFFPQPNNPPTPLGIDRICHTDGFRNVTIFNGRYRSTIKLSLAGSEIRVINWPSNCAGSILPDPRNLKEFAHGYNTTQENCKEDEHCAESVAVTAPDDKKNTVTDGKTLWRPVSFRGDCPEDLTTARQQSNTAKTTKKKADETDTLNPDEVDWLPPQWQLREDGSFAQKGLARDGGLVDYGYRTQPPNEGFEAYYRMGRLGTRRDGLTTKLRDDGFPSFVDRVEAILTTSKIRFPSDFRAASDAIHNMALARARGQFDWYLFGRSATNEAESLWDSMSRLSVTEQSGCIGVVAMTALALDAAIIQTKAYSADGGVAEPARNVAYLARLGVDYLLARPRCIEDGETFRLAKLMKNWADLLHKCSTDGKEVVKVRWGSSEVGCRELRAPPSQP